MKGFKPTMKMAHGGKVRYAEGGLSEKLGPPDNTENLKKRRSVSDVLEHAREYYVGPKKSRKGTYTPPDTTEADTQIRRMIESNEYKKGGKVQKVMHEFKAGKLHSGSKKGPMVKNRKQAISIALSEAGKSKKG